MSQPTVTADQITAIVRDLAPAPNDDLGPDTRLVEDLGYHSLALLELAFALEDEFDLEPIDEQTARRITTVGLVVETVLERVAERDGASSTPVTDRA
ncbi:phosphopantetheine-binding protein [Micromonospora sp. NPDC049891]|uniref:phosphopantetheine-binding protein n=1 Tax=Micromonospora sp. NPDC049891 TaxID=3155655 RepID=UPI0033CD0FE6